MSTPNPNGRRPFKSRANAAWRAQDERYRVLNRMVQDRIFESYRDNVVFDTPPPAAPRPRLGQRVLNAVCGIIHRVFRSVGLAIAGVGVGLASVSWGL